MSGRCAMLSTVSLPPGVSQCLPVSPGVSQSLRCPAHHSPFTYSCLAPRFLTTSALRRTVAQRGPLVSTGVRWEVQGSAQEHSGPLGSTGVR